MKFVVAIAAAALSLSVAPAFAAAKKPVVAPIQTTFGKPSLTGNKPGPVIVNKPAIGTGVSGGKLIGNDGSTFKGGNLVGAGGMNFKPR